LSLLRNEGVLAPDTPVRIRAVGIEYGAQSSTVAAVVDDSLALKAAVLTDERLRSLAVGAVGDADQAVRALGHLAEDLAVARGQSTEGVRGRAAERAYAALDAAYRRWVGRLTTTTDAGRARLRWQENVWTTVARLAHTLVREAGTAGWVGRPRERGHVNSSQALLWFDRALATALDLAAQARREQREEYRSQHEEGVGV
jgi:CRISPR system Cascade subunit CasA